MLAVYCASIEMSMRDMLATVGGICQVSGREAMESECKQVKADEFELRLYEDGNRLEASK